MCPNAITGKKLFEHKDKFFHRPANRARVGKEGGLPELCPGIDADAMREFVLELDTPLAKDPDDLRKGHVLVFVSHATGG